MCSEDEEGNQGNHALIDIECCFDNEELVESLSIDSFASPTTPTVELNPWARPDYILRQIAEAMEKLRKAPSSEATEKSKQAPSTEV